MLLLRFLLVIILICGGLGRINRKTLDSKFESLKKQEREQRLVESGVLTTSIGQVS